MKRKTGKVFLRSFIVGIIFVILPCLVFASQTDGTIDNVFKYAWGNRIGWVNFGTAGGNIHVTDSKLTGYAWGANSGWIKMDPAQGGVKNDGNGNLSGSAWGEDTGYINFSSVKIDSSGQFSGRAYGDTPYGIINFDCVGCLVKTDWRPQSVRGGNPPPVVSPPGGGAASGPGWILKNLPPISKRHPICDFNNDGKCNIIDLSILLYYMKQPVDVAAPFDLSGDGVIDIQDISILLYYWVD